MAAVAVCDWLAFDSNHVACTRQHGSETSLSCCIHMLSQRIQSDPLNEANLLNMMLCYTAQLSDGIPELIAPDLFLLAEHWEVRRLSLRFNVSD